jgi:hypothetical protein
MKGSERKGTPQGSPPRGAVSCTAGPSISSQLQYQLTAAAHSCSGEPPQGSRLRAARPTCMSPVVMVMVFSSVVRMLYSTSWKYPPCGSITFSSRRRRDCQDFAGIPSPCMWRRLLKRDGGAAEWRSRRRLITFSAGRNFSSTSASVASCPKPPNDRMTAGRPRRPPPSFRWQVFQYTTGVVGERQQTGSLADGLWRRGRGGWP